ncbi:hypothetical protein PIB30_011821 [Stylosanthes scabra]|uniref:Uncharacterized protein n=1 Tax=Stylosanthes scabra TaxID=79078 RepID=A0ABU6S669_9FABA|nr:hypothetical protein [Stylosanthes scabra]
MEVGRCDGGIDPTRRILEFWPLRRRGWGRAEPIRCDGGGGAARQWRQTVRNEEMTVGGGVVLCGGGGDGKRGVTVN